MENEFNSTREEQHGNKKAGLSLKRILIAFVTAPFVVPSMTY
jgi:hypothetical protein